MIEDGQSRAVDLRNTGELDLDNTSERTCFLTSPPLLRVTGKLTLAVHHLIFHHVD
jgi:hypothetical protein